MKNKRTILFSKVLSRLLIVTLLTIMSQLAMAQTEPPPTDSVPIDPGSISVYTIQNMSFGAFINGPGGGTVSISPTGTRSSTGAVIPVNLGVTYCQAIFEVDAPLGTTISILNGPDATLTGSNGGSMTLAIGSADPASPFTTTVAQPSKTQVNIGGTLTVGTGSLPGTYVGTFSITFNIE